MKKASWILCAALSVIVSHGSVAHAAGVRTVGTRKIATPNNGTSETSAYGSSASNHVTRFEVSGLSSGAFFFDDEGHTGLLGGGLAYQFSPGIQMALTALYVRGGYSGDNVWLAAGFLGPVFNFPFQVDLRDTFFASAKYGIAKVGGSDIDDTDDDTSPGMWSLSVGKRFKLTESISYTPDVGMIGIFGDNADSVFRITPLSFSLMF